MDEFGSVIQLSVVHANIANDMEEKTCSKTYYGTDGKE